MQDERDRYWDDLGVTWRASITDAGLVSSRLRARVEGQGALLNMAASLSAAITLLGAALALWTLWAGWTGHAWHFLVRGATLAAVSLLALIATMSLRSHGAGEALSLTEMLEISITRTRRLVKAADLGCVALVVLAVGGTAGYAIRARFAARPSVSPVEDLLALGVVFVALMWFRWSRWNALTTYRRLSQAVGS